MQTIYLTEVKRSFDAMVEAEAAFKADLEKLLKNEGHMPEDKFLVMSRKGKRLGVAYVTSPVAWRCLMRRVLLRSSS
jgi:hypothetical protein